MFANFIPISLIVTLDVVRLFYGVFIAWDVEIYDPEKDMYTRVQASNLNEELG
jgi:phospholipid-transporting ATPase